MTNQTTQDQNASDLALIAGIAKRAPNVVWTLLGQQYTGPQLTTLIQSRVTARQKSAAAHTAWIQAADDAKALTQQTSPILRAFQKVVEGQFANDATALGDFGLSAPKKAQKPVKVKAQAADKAAATRKSNNTMGKQQKKEAAKARAAQGQPAPASPAPAPASPAPEPAPSPAAPPAAPAKGSSAP